jgi:hypothetical protein
MIKKVTEFVIDRAKWGNGDVLEAAQDHFMLDEDDDADDGACAGDMPNASDQSYLYREDGLMCCLGIYATACGASEDDLLNKEMPEYVPEQKVKALFDSWSHKDLQQVASTNDFTSMLSDAREAEITSFFSKGGIKVTFVGVISDAIDTMKRYWSKNG